MGFLSQPSEYSDMKPISLGKMEENGGELCSYASWLVSSKVAFACIYSILNDLCLG